MESAHSLLVGKKDGMRECEELLRHIRKYAAKNESTSLEIPNTIAHRGALGRSAAVAQMISTWAEISPTQEIKTWLDAAEPLSNSKKFVGLLHGFAATLYADKVYDAKREKDLKQELLSATAGRIRAMSERDINQATTGVISEFLFVHHAQHEFHSVAYIREPSVAELLSPEKHGKLIKDAREMDALLASILKEQGKTEREISRIGSLREHPLFEEKSPSLGLVIHEIFRNTAEHAYLDKAGNIPKKGVRCISVAARHVDLGTVCPEALVSGSHAGADEYFSFLRETVGSSRRKNLCVLEITIFDTGPGFAGTIKHRRKNKSDAELVLECFRDHVTSKGGGNSGLGLGRALQNVGELDGYVRVRTSTTEAFYSRFTNEDGGTRPMPDVAGNLPRVAGTVFTVAVPLELEWRSGRTCAG